MKFGDIRSRLLLAALLPVALVVVLLAVVHLFDRIGDIAQAHTQRQRSLARQLATACEYGLFSANSIQLSAIAAGALREADVQSVSILDRSGRLLARSGHPMFKTPPTLEGQEHALFDPVNRIELVVQPVQTSELRIEDWPALAPDQALKASPPLGHLLMEFSRQSLDRREREMQAVGLAVALGGLLFGGALAWYLGRGVLRPVLRVSDLIDRIGDGELSARLEVLPDDPLRRLQLGLNQMAERLEQGRDELEQRVIAATQDLREKKEEAEAATLSKSRFLAAASHDLRQPTHAMGMFVARLAQLPHDAQSQHLISNLEASVLALQDLLDALLDLSRLEAKAVPVHLRPFALADLFAHIQDELALTAREKGLRLRVRATGVWLMSDPTLLHRMLLNLVVNALRYTNQGGVLLACRVCAGGSRGRIEVWDSGIGIAAEHHESIFKEFFQIGNAERDRGKGLGLGLAIVARKAELLGYRVQVCSRLGQGTRFSFDVPLIPPGSAVDRRSSVRTPALDSLAGLRVLVVEDDLLARAGLVSLLESWGARVAVAPSGAVAYLQLQPDALPDVIVSDYRLRDGENGIEVIGQLRAAAARLIPACLMSGDTDLRLVQTAKEAGLPLLHKPVRPAKLRSLIRHLALQAEVGDQATV